MTTVEDGPICGIATMDRRIVLMGTALAVAIVDLPAAPVRASEGKIQMRKMLVATLREAEASVERASYSTFWQRRRAIACDQLAEFDRGEGRWWEIALRHPSGIPESLIDEEDARQFLESTAAHFSEFSQNTNPPTLKCALRKAHQDAIAALAEFERGEGPWREHMSPRRIVTRIDSLS